MTTLYNLSRSTLEERGRRGARVVAETDSTKTVRVLDLFDTVVLKDDESLTPCLERDGFWEAWITSWFTRWVRPGMSVLDIGANCGYYTMLLDNLVGPYGHVVAYEPNPVYAELLRTSRAINNSNFYVREVALSDKPGMVTLSVPGDYHGSASIVTDFTGSKWGPESHYDVRATTLDSELQRLVFFDYDVIKMDAEGAEQLIWNGGLSLWTAEKSHATIVLEYTPGSYTPEFLQELGAWGTVHAITDLGGETPVSIEQIARLTDWAMLVIRRK